MPPREPLGLRPRRQGILLQHLASALFPQWGEFGKFCGRNWVMGKSGHGPRGVFTAKIADDKHPITAGLKDFQADDELYAKLAGTEAINVLVEADSDWSKKTEPLVFWLPYGQGRVVHSTWSRRQGDCHARGDHDHRPRR